MFSKAINLFSINYNINQQIIIKFNQLKLHLTFYNLFYCLITFERYSFHNRMKFKS